MVARRIRRSVSKCVFSCTGWAAAIAYLTLSLGIQLPLPAASKNSAQPYPCMNHPCGCASAEECWRHCCCTTLEERLRWARENHVTPPEYALAEARARGIDWEGFCNVGPEHNSRICHDGEEIKPTCCKHSHSDSQHANPQHGISWLQALACKGGAQNWIGLSTSLPPPAVAKLLDSTIAAELFALPPDRFSSISLAPPTPPPRILAA